MLCPNEPIKRAGPAAAEKDIEDCIGRAEQSVSSHGRQARQRVDTAVGVIMGAAFGNIITSLVNDTLMPPIGLLLGSVDLCNG